MVAAPNTNRLNKTESVIFVSLVCSLFLDDLHPEDILIHKKYLNVSVHNIKCFIVHFSWPETLVLLYCACDAETKTKFDRCSTAGIDLHCLFLALINTYPIWLSAFNDILRHSVTQRMLHDSNSVSFNG